MSWIPVHEEQPRADLSVEAWLNDDQNNLIFVRGDRGLRYSVYSCMEDALTATATSRWRMFATAGTRCSGRSASTKRTMIS